MVLYAHIRESAGALDLDAAAPGEAVCDSPWEVARRLGLGGGVCLWLSEASRGASPNAEQKAFLRKTRCTVGPFALEQVDAMREWLHEGASRAIITLDGTAPLDVALPAAIARGTTGLPAERLILLLPVGPLGDPATLATLLQDLEQVAARKGSGCLECAAPDTVGAVGGVLLALTMPSGAEARTRETDEDNLVQALTPFTRRVPTQALTPFTRRVRATGTQARTLHIAHRISHRRPAHSCEPCACCPATVTTGCVCG